MQKRENQKYRDEIEEFKEIVATKQEDEEQIDLNKFTGPEPPLQHPMQSKLMQTRLNSQMRGRTA